jgi:hypothetical protein
VRPYPRRVQSDESPTEPSVQLPLLVDEAPEEAAPLLDTIERLRAHASVYVSSTFQDMTAANTVRSILQRQASAMEAMRADFERSPVVATLFPDFTGDDYRALIRALIPTKPEELAAAERTIEVARVDPENRKLVARITEHLASRTQVTKLTPWAVFVMVSLDLLKVAPEINPNDIGVLTMILMVVLYLLPPRSGS